MVVPGRENEQESGKTGGMRGGLTETIYILAPQVKANHGSREVYDSPLEFAPNYCNQKHYFPFPSKYVQGRSEPAKQI
jgi:hypothetical protein